ncbi:MAG: hypothetical protein ACRYGF_12150 [Janthinobacterium lividum]
MGMILLVICCFVAIFRYNSLRSALQVDKQLQSQLAQREARTRAPEDFGQRLSAAKESATTYQALMQGRNDERAYELQLGVASVGILLSGAIFWRQRKTSHQ